MLVLSRRVNERIKIGSDVVITVVRCGADVVRIGIEAPKRLAILREELLDREPDPAPAVARQTAA